MADSRFDRLVELFEQAATLRPAERRALLDSLQDEDSELRSELQALLAGHEQTEGLLERRRDLQPLLTGETSGDVLEGVGDSIGPYRLERELGQGGMGTVYLAHQEDPIRRDVALKVIRSGLDSREIIARFLSERQVLAQMDHPAIARVFDAGETPSGRPFFVMELQEGSPITHYCDEHRLSVRERLELFAVVCEAVQHAHRRGIIHRDLKPSNVLVTEVDGRPLPKVIDFGVAKAVDPGGVDPVLTTDRQLIGTPEYMSLEQWEATGDIDTRTDVYSLGVLLYRLLVGVLPFERGEGEGVGALFRTLTSEEAPAPSLRLSTLGKRGQQAAVLRRADVGSLRRQLQGDLDWIVLKAMAKDREERYDSAAELAAELGRYLRHEPLVAGPPGTLYQLRKSARRHRRTLLAVAAVFVALVAGLVSTNLALVEARRSRAAAEEQAAIAEAVNRFLNEDLLAAAGPERSGDREKTVREVLDQAAARMEEKFDGPPSVEAEILATLGTAYHQLGEHDQASRWRAAAYHLRHETLGPEHPDTIASAIQLAVAMRELQRLDEAEGLLTETLATARRALGPNDPLVLSGLFALEMVYQEQGDLERALTLSREILERTRRIHGAESPKLGVALNNLALALHDMHSSDEAIEYGRQSLELHRRLFGEDHTNTMQVAGNLAGMYMAAERYEEAVSLLRETTAALDGILGPDHTITLTQRMNLASALGMLGQYAEAVDLARQAYDGLSRSVGPHHALSLAALRSVAVNLDRQGSSSEAAVVFAEAIAGARDHLPPRHWYTGVFLSQYGRCLVHLGRFEEAEAALQEGWSILEEALDEHHVRRLEALEIMVDLYHQWGRPEEEASWDESLVHAQQAGSAQAR